MRLMRNAVILSVHAIAIAKSKNAKCNSSCHIIWFSGSRPALINVCSK